MTRARFLMLACAGCFDFNVPDLPHPDLSVERSDLAVEDLALSGPDLAALPDAAASPDLASAPDQGLARCGRASTCPPGSVLCEGFESGIDGRWSPYNLNGGSEQADGVHVCRGSSALHLRTPPADGSNFVVATLQTMPALGSTVAIRAFVFPAAPLGSNDETYLEVSQSTAPFAGIQLGQSAGQLFVSSSVATPSSFVTSATSLPADRWSCVEVDIDLDPVNGQVTVWLDDGPITDLTLQQPTQASPPLSLLTIGAGGDGSSPNLWIDEVVIAAEHLGCTR
jgi:hypothetical protein